MKPNAALQRPGDNYIVGKLSIRGLLIPVRFYKRSFRWPLVTPVCEYHPSAY